MKYHFQPPQHNPLVIALLNLVYPPLLRVRDQVDRVVISDGDWARIEALKGNGALLLPNHPSVTEPAIMGWMARRLRQPMFYVATHELFTGWEGWFIRRVGAFSIIRGRADLSAARMCRQVLADLDRILVMFPEGETHMENDLILPLHSGAVGFGFAALKRRAALGKSPHVPVVPVLIKYRYVGDPRPVLAAGMARLEHHLGLVAAPGRGLRDRALRAGYAVLDGIEKEYGLHAGSAGSAPASTELRIAAINDFITGRVSHTLHVTVPADATTAQKMRMLFNATYDYLDCLKAGKTPYERRLHAHRLTAARACLNDLWRLQNFMVISADYLADPLIAERFGEMLYRLDTEVFGKAMTIPRREAVVRIGEPLDLADAMTDFVKNPRAAIAAVTATLESRMRAILDSMATSGVTIT